MAPNRNNKDKDKKVAISFDEMIQADRKRRKAEELAQQIFGKNRRASAPSAGNKRGNTQSPGASFASRVGVTKNQSQSRSSSFTNDKRQNNGNNNNNSRAQSQNNRNPKRPFHNAAVVDPSPAAAIAPSQQNKQNNASAFGNEISIRGAAGPYCVVASNFAPGTTAADIESVMLPIGGTMLGCRLISSNPTVIVEMVFVERSGAENVIAMFNNKKADGKVLYVYMKEGGPSQPIGTQSTPATPAFGRSSQAAAPVSKLPPPVQPVDDAMEVEPESMMADYSNGNADVNADVNANGSVHSGSRGDEVPRAPREHYRPPYRDDFARGPRRVENDFQDNRYGPQDQQYPRHGGGYGGGGYRDDRRGRFRDDGRMYSDSMMGRGGNGGGRFRR